MAEGRDVIKPGARSLGGDASSMVTDTQVARTEGLQAWMQDRSDAAMAALTEVHFDFRSRCTESNAGSRRPRKAVSTTPARPRTSAGRTHVVVGAGRA